jgi:hypothetical protein
LLLLFYLHRFRQRAAADAEFVQRIFPNNSSEWARRLLAKLLTQDVGFSKKRTLRGFRIVAYRLKAVATALCRRTNAFLALKAF